MRVNMRTNTGILLAVLTVLVVVGCAGPALQVMDLPDPGTEPRSTDARIYIYRQSMVGGANPISFYDGNRLIGSIPYKRYLCYDRQPGKLTIKAKCYGGGNASGSHSLNVEAGKTYYIAAYIDMTMKEESADKASAFVTTLEAPSLITPPESCNK